MNVRIERHELGPRLFAGRLRIHHYHWGELFVLLGAWLIWVDRADLHRMKGTL